MHQHQHPPSVGRRTARARPRFPTLDALNDRYREQRYLFIQGKDVVRLVKGLGARTEDLKRLRRVSDHLAPDPTLPFRESRNGRFCIDYRRRRIERLEFQPFVLTAEEDFVRHDSGKIREFRGIDDELQLNTVFQALLLLKAALIKDVSVAPRPKLKQNAPQLVVTVFNLRTVTTPALLGEPALEGVHSDGVDHTMTTYLGSDNMTDESAITFLHDPQEKNGTRWDAADPRWRRGQVQHRHFLDTLLLVDHEFKHSLSPVFANDPSQRAIRDMLIFFTRFPTEVPHVSHPYDSLRPHRELPMRVCFPPPLAGRSEPAAESADVR